MTDIKSIDNNTFCIVQLIFCVQMFLFANFRLADFFVGGKFVVGNFFLNQHARLKMNHDR